MILENIGVRVTDEDFKNELRERLFLMLRSCKSPNMFPGSQPVSFGSQHFEWLESEDYYICEKSDGIRYLLYFCNPPSGPTAFLVRKITFLEDYSC